jgi:hypothetical protein
MDSFSIGIFRHYVTAKEGYSDYVFEDSATTILKENPKLKPNLSKKQSDSKFMSNPEAQLDWIYKHSIYYEKAHLQYPSIVL